jgi:peptide/nickel transport system ATP-binding protein
MVDILVFENVTITFTGRSGTSHILNDVSFSVTSGGALGLVGESGCGKSTAALAAMRYLPAGMRVTSGRILLEGNDIATRSENELRQLRGRRVAMVYQDPMSSLNPVITIGDQLVEVVLLHGEADRARARKRAVTMLEEVRLADAEAMLGRYPHQLSGGQQQRVVIAMALMAKPALLIMDEPTTGLDVTIEAAILELVRDLRAKFGAAILFISHNLGTVARLCDRIGVLYAGRMVETGAIGPVFHAPAHPYTRGLLAALPRLDADRRQACLKPIEGSIAADDRERSGCAFAPRCPYMLAAECVEKFVPMVALDGCPTRMVRCARLGHIPPVASAPATQQPASPGLRPDGPILLDVSSLSKHYRVGGRFGGKTRLVRAVNEASVAARPGQTLAIVGESGCGKSTLAKVIAGLVPATSGAARLGGSDLANIAVDQRPRDLRRRIQMVFQNPDSTLNPSHTVEYSLMRPLRLLRGINQANARREVARLMELVRLPADLARRLPHQLSGGQRQRVAIARALAGEPDLVIADEPVSALDVSVQAAIVNLLEDLLERSRIGLVMISHDLALVRHMADWVAVMYLGRVVEYGPAAQVFAPPYHPYTKALLAAVPKPDPSAGPPEIILSGTMPSPTQHIKGCPFFSRCPHRIEGLCETQPAPIRRFGEHTIACQLDLAVDRPLSAAARD